MLLYSYLSCFVVIHVVCSNLCFSSYSCSFVVIRVALKVFMLFSSYFMLLCSYLCWFVPIYVAW